MSTLYELTNEYLQLLEMASDPEIDPQLIEDTLEGLDGEVEAKADGYAKVIAELKVKSSEIRAKGDAIIDEGKRINSVADAIDKNIDKMKAHLQKTMEVTGKIKFKTELFSFLVKKNPKKVVIDDEAQVPVEFLKIKTEVDKKLLGEALGREDNEITYAHLEQGSSLVIK